jgi:hypothetical protein
VSPRPTAADLHGFLAELKRDILEETKRAYGEKRKRLSPPLPPRRFTRLFEISSVNRKNAMRREQNRDTLK